MIIPFECSRKDILLLKERADRLAYLARLKNQPVFKPAQYDKEAESDRFYKGILYACTKEDGTIDGSNLSLLNFPFERDEYHVFISYSHDDEPLAIVLYQWLESHGLKCFLDSTIWHSADKLLSAIDYVYSMSDDKIHFDYRKRNFSTSHVHAMLSMAMLEAIDRSECCIFIKSENSVPLEEGIADKTLSPWIYEENLFMDKIRRRIPSRFYTLGTKSFSRGGQIVLENSRQKLRVSYNLQCEFEKLTGDDLFSIRGLRTLDKLYERFGVITRQELID